jgi:hypothetical protein
MAANARGTVRSPPLKGCLLEGLRSEDRCAFRYAPDVYLFSAGPTPTYWKSRPRRVRHSA